MVVLRRLWLFQGDASVVASSLFLLLPLCLYGFGVVIVL